MKKTIDRKLLLLKPDRILCPVFPTRRFYDDFNIKPLADSISANGIIEPLIVRKNQNGSFELVCGYRRLAAAKSLGLRRVPCIKISADDQTAFIISISENSNRTHLNFFEEGEAILNIKNRFGLDYPKISDVLGIPQSVVLNRIKLLKLNNSVRKRIIGAGLDEKYAALTLMLCENKQHSFLNAVISDGLSYESAKALARQYILGDIPQKEKEEQISQAPQKIAVGDVRLFANSLSKLIVTMQNSGIEAYSKRTENEKYIEYKVRIPKPQAENYKQLRLV